MGFGQKIVSFKRSESQQVEAVFGSARSACGCHRLIFYLERFFRAFWRDLKDNKTFPSQGDSASSSRVGAFVGSVSPVTEPETAFP